MVWKIGRFSIDDSIFRTSRPYRGECSLEKVGSACAVSRNILSSKLFNSDKRCDKASLTTTSERTLLELSIVSTLVMSCLSQDCINVTILELLFCRYIGLRFSDGRKMRPGRISVFDRRKYPLGRPMISTVEMHKYIVGIVKNNLQLYVPC